MYTTSVLKVTSRSHWKLTGDWQKNTCTTKAVRKIYTELGKKGSEAIRSGSVSLAGDKEEEGDYTGGDIPWVVSGLSHILGAPGLASETRKMSPLSCLENQWDWQESCKKPSLHSWKVYTHCLLPKHGRRSRLKLQVTLADFLQPKQCGAPPERSTCFVSHGQQGSSTQE